MGGELFIKKWFSDSGACLSGLFGTWKSWEADPFCLLQMLKGSFSCDGCVVKESGAFAPDADDFSRFFGRCRYSSSEWWAREAVGSISAYRYGPGSGELTTKGFAYALGEKFLPELKKIKIYLEEKVK
jgi:hypothetical protein